MIRALGLRGALALNIITMVGIGPLITIPLVLATLHGPLSLAGWILGAMLALCDGLVWAELGSLFPRSGGTYGFLRGAFPVAIGRFLAFLFVWEMIFAGPLLLASGYLGFANYATYFSPRLAASAWAIKTIAALVGLVTLAALYRPVRSTGRVGVWLGAAVIATLLFVSLAGYVHWSPHRLLALPAGDSFWRGLFGGLGAALVITLYDYAGYGQATYVADEILAPSRTLPHAIVLSIAIVGVLYVGMQVAVLGAIPWQQLSPNFPGSQIVEQSFGRTAAYGVTALILLAAFASVYGNLLGFSRIPYAAAIDGAFLAPFARLHARLHVPAFSLVAIGLLAIAACAFTLDQVISALTAALVLVQSVAQIVALLYLRSKKNREGYRMPLFPLPALLALGGWLFVFASTGFGPIVFGIVSVGAGAVAYVVFVRSKRAAA